MQLGRRPEGLRPNYGGSIPPATRSPLRHPPVLSAPQQLPAMQRPEGGVPMTTPQWIQRVCHRMGHGTTKSDESGFTLLEVIVSFAIFAIVAASAATAIYKAVHASHLNQQRTNAAGVAQSVIADAIAKANLNTVLPEQGKTI